MSLLLTWGLKFSEGTTVVPSNESVERRNSCSVDSHVRESKLNISLGRTVPVHLTIEQVDPSCPSTVQHARSGPRIHARPVVIGEER
jgi:hypothetical protein